jgi:hypothetical protein
MRSWDRVNQKEVVKVQRGGEKQVVGEYAEWRDIDNIWTFRRTILTPLSGFNIKPSS